MTVTEDRGERTDRRPRQQRVLVTTTEFLAKQRAQVKRHHEHRSAAEAVRDEPPRAGARGLRRARTQPETDEPSNLASEARRRRFGTRIQQRRKDLLAARRAKRRRQGAQRGPCHALAAHDATAGVVARSRRATRRPACSSRSASARSAVRPAGVRACDAGARFAYTARQRRRALQRSRAPRGRTACPSITAPLHPTARQPAGRSRSRAAARRSGLPPALAAAEAGP